MLLSMLHANASLPEMITFISNVAHCVEKAATALLPLLASIQSAHEKLRPDSPAQQQLLIIFNLLPADLTPWVATDLKGQLREGITLANSDLAMVCAFGMKYWI